MSEIKISVIVPSYKPGAYVFECLESLFNQTVDSRFVEIILVLNGCNEPYYSNLVQFINSIDWAGHISIIQTDSPGVSNARNLALDLIKGEYVTFIDDDDFVSQTYLEELLRVSGPDTIGISNELCFNETNNGIIEDSISKEYQRQAPKGKQRYERMRRFFSGPWMKLIHREMIGPNRFDFRFTNGEDSLFLFQISKNFNYVDFTSPKAVYYRRIRNNSAMGRERNAKYMVKNRSRLIKQYLHLYLTDSTSYSFVFLMTRVLGSVHSILNAIVGLIKGKFTRSLSR